MDWKKEKARRHRTHRAAHGQAVLAALHSNLAVQAARAATDAASSAFTPSAHGAQSSASHAAAVSAAIHATQSAQSSSSSTAANAASLAVTHPAQSAQSSASTATNATLAAIRATQSAQSSSSTAANAVSVATPPAHGAQSSASHANVTATLQSTQPASTFAQLSLKEEGVIIPRALFEAHSRELARLGIFEGVTYKGPQENESGPRMYPVSKIGFPNVQGLPDPLRPRYATNEYVKGIPTSFVHKQTPGTKLSLRTNEDGWSAFSKTVKHYAAHMHSRKEHSLAPQSAPYKSGAMARASQVPWNHSTSRLTISAPSARGPKVFSRPKMAKTAGNLSETPKEVRLETLTRSLFTVTDTEVKAPMLKIYVCPEHICGQEFHEDTTKQMIIDHLLYKVHTNFSFYKGENVCPFSCKKGFHDVDLLKAHIEERNCVLAGEFDNLQEAIRYQAEMEAHLRTTTTTTARFACLPCDKSYATLHELFFHINGTGCRYMEYKEVHTEVPVKDKDPEIEIALPEPRLLQRPSKKRALIFFRHSANSGHDNSGETDGGLSPSSQLTFSQS